MAREGALLTPLRARLRRALRTARELFPLTWVGASVAAGAALALELYGLGSFDLLLLVTGLLGVGLSAVATGLVLVTSPLLFFYLRRREGQPLTATCGVPVDTGFQAPSLWFVPFLVVTTRWSSPRGDVRAERRGITLHERVTPSQRGVYDEVEREIEVGDAFGLARVTFRVREARQLRVLPSVGKLADVQVVRSIAAGDDRYDPEGVPDGDRVDMRPYVPGDPVRFILWKVYARTREVMLRAPERAVSPSRRAVAYLVAAEHDEPAAGVARHVVERGALGPRWVLGADGVAGSASTAEEAIDLVCRSAHAPEPSRGAGLTSFIDREAGAGPSRVIVFVPPRPGPWLARLLAQVAARTRNAPRGEPPFRFVVCTDSVSPDEPPGLLRRLALRPALDDGARTPQRDLREVARALQATRCPVTIIDRQTGRETRHLTRD